METRDESLPTDEPDLAQQNTDATAPVLQHVSKIAPVINPVTPTPAPNALQKQRITRFISDIRPTPGSNVVRIYGISDCVIAVAFTLFVVDIALPPEGLSTSQLQDFIFHDLLLKIVFFLPAYIVVASSWVSHYRILTYLKRSSSLFHHIECIIPGIDRLSSRPRLILLPIWQPVRGLASIRNHTNGHQYDTSLHVDCCESGPPVGSRNTFRISQIHHSSTLRHPNRYPSLNWRRVLQCLDC